MSYKNKVAKLRKNSELQVNILAFFITKKRTRNQSCPYILELLKINYIFTDLHTLTVLSFVVILT